MEGQEKFYLTCKPLNAARPHLYNLADNPLGFPVAVVMFDIP